MKIRIRVRFLGPDNAGRGARYQARSSNPRGSVTMPYNYAAGPEKSSLEVAEKLCRKLGIGQPTQVEGQESGVRVYEAHFNEPGRWIQRMIDVSTHHMPEGEHLDLNAGESRAVPHENGWIVFVDGGLKDDVDRFVNEVPEWLRPVYRLALETESMLINFDKDGPLVAGLPTWEW